MDRSVDRSQGRNQRESEPVALRSLVEREQQAHAGGVDEGQAAQIEHQPRADLEAVQRGAQGFGDGDVESGPQRLDRGHVELAAGLHDRDVIAALHLNRERLEIGHLGCSG